MKILKYMKNKKELNNKDKNLLIELNSNLISPSNPLLLNAIKNNNNKTIEHIAGEYFVYFNNKKTIEIIPEYKQKEFLSKIRKEKLKQKKVLFEFNKEHNMYLTNDLVLCKTQYIKKIKKILNTNNKLNKVVINKRNTINKNSVDMHLKDYGIITLKKSYFNHIKKQKIKEIYTINKYPAPIIFKCEKWFYCIAPIINGGMI